MSLENRTIEGPDDSISWAKKQIEAVKIDIIDKQVKDISNEKIIEHLKNISSLVNNAQDVIFLQIALARLGYDPGKIDGIYKTKNRKTSNTINAVQIFQKDNKLLVDGQAGKKTIGKIIELLSKSSPPPTPPVPEPSPEPIPPTPPVPEPSPEPIPPTPPTPPVPEPSPEPVIVPIIHPNPNRVSPVLPEPEPQHEQNMKSYRTMEDFLKDNEKYKNIFTPDIKTEMIISDTVTGKTEIWTQEGKIDILEHEIMVYFSDDPDDKPAIVGIESVIPISNERIKEIILLTKSFGKLSPSREYTYRNDFQNSHIFLNNEGSIQIYFSADKKNFFYTEYDTHGNILRQQYLPVNDEIRYNFDIDESNGKIIRQERKTSNGELMFQDSYHIEMDPKQSNRFMKTKGTPVLELGNGVKIEIFNGTNFENEDAYLEYLARNLDTPYKLSKFFTEMLRYVYDSEKSDYKLPGDERTPESGDYYWNPHSLIRRTREHGYMIGDCDDYAGLAYKILKLQGKKVYEVAIPGHAITVGIDKTPDGKYIVYSLCTYGLDINGIREPFSMNETWEKYKVDDPKQAYNAILRKYSLALSGDIINIYDTSENVFDETSGTWRVHRNISSKRIEELY